VKRIGCFLLVALLLSVLMGGISCQGKTPEYTTATPEGTIRLLLDAYQDLNTNKAAKLFVKEDREKVLSKINPLWSQYKSVSLSEVKIEVITQTENTAKLKVHYHVVITKKVGPQDPFPFRKSDDKYDLVKQGDEWLIKAPPDL